MGGGRSVRFGVPASTAFGYLVDPHHRPEWQSSLRRVEDVSPALPAVGQTWVDVTVPGLRPRMVTTVLERATTWTEVGTWHGIAAELTLDFAADGAGGGDDGGGGVGCRVTPTFRVTGRGAAYPVAWLLDRVAVHAVLPDLRRAAHLLAERA